MERRQVVALSPHLDDAALSCGGVLFDHTRAGGSATIVTLFAGTPSLPTPLGVQIQTIWGVSDWPMADVVEMRRQEDRQAAAILGCSLRHLDWLDAIYRVDAEGDALYRDLPSIRALSPADAGLADEISGALAAAYPPGEVRFLAPLAIGGHVDHQITHRAALLLLRDGYQVDFYEEFPHVLNPEVVARVAAEHEQSGEWTRLRLAISEQAVAARAAAICAYRSQLGMLVDLAGDRTGLTAEQAITDLVRRHVTSIPGARAAGELAEQQWRRSGSDAFTPH